MPVLSDEMMHKKIAIIGAGPVGLEAALTAIERGYEVTVYERGSIADAVRQWGHVRMFSPFEMNASERTMARLRARGVALPRADALLTGAEFQAKYLEPLALTMRAHIHEDCAVLAVGRERMLKGDHIHDPVRAGSRFRLLVGERIEVADIILDCSGTFFQPNKLGGGGIPAPGESSCSARIHYGLPDLKDGGQERFANKRVLVVGAGHSAATSICDIAELKATAPQTEIVWLIRRDRKIPCEEIPNDRLAERAALIAKANHLVAQKQATLISGSSIESIAPRNGALLVSLGGAEENRTLKVDEIIAATGFRPDLALTRELQVQTCWATEGTYPLAASLLGEAGVDCLQTPAFGVEMLRHPEPDFFTLGMKSYGRSSNFLLRTGYQQVATVFDWLESRRTIQHPPMDIPQIA
jgi:thioredoxin reductase